MKKLFTAVLAFAAFDAFAQTPDRMAWNALDAQRVFNMEARREMMAPPRAAASAIQLPTASERDLRDLVARTQNPAQQLPMAILLREPPAPGSGPGRK